MKLQDLRICMVGPHYPRPGGVTTQVELLSAHLRDEGVDVRPVDTNVRWLRRLGRLGRLVMPLVQSVLVPARLWRAGRDSHLFHVHLASFWGFYLPMTAALVVARLRRVPVVATFHGGRAASFVRDNRRLVRALLKRSAALIVLSPYTGQVFEAIGLQPVVVPNIAQVDQFRPRPAASAAPPDPGQPRLLWIKTFDPSGNPLPMVRVFARLHRQLPEARLTMVGEGRMRAEAQSLARWLEVPITFTGQVPFETVKDLYAGADLFVSTSAVDNQPSTFLEASACGLPIVATAVGGVPYLVEDGVNALLVPPGDEEAFVEAVLRVVSDPQLAARLSRAAVENARQYSWPVIREKLGALYLQVARGGDR